MIRYKVRDRIGEIRMKFVLFDLISNHPNGVSGELLTSQERIQQAIDQAVFAESLGFDGYGVGERHGAPFLSSSPAILLTAIAAKTSKIRLLPTVSVLSILDPVRVAEDYATLDHLSGGRLEMMIGKGNDPRHYPLFGIKEEEQWASLAERYDLLKRLWTEENVSWEGTYRPPLCNVTTEPRPFQKRFPFGMAVHQVHFLLSLQLRMGNQSFHQMPFIQWVNIKS